MSDSIRKALDTMGAAIAADPAKARAKNAPATARLTGGLACEVSGPQGQRMQTDMPAPMGGAGSAPNPGWYLRGAIASCAATVIAMRAAALGVRLDMLEVTVESDADLRGILGIGEARAGQSAVRTIVRIRGSADEGTLREIVAWAEDHSPVGCTLKHAPAYSVDVQIL